MSYTTNKKNNGSKWQRTLSKIEKFYIDNNKGILTPHEISKDLRINVDLVEKRLSKKVKKPIKSNTNNNTVNVKKIKHENSSVLDKMNEFGRNNGAVVMTQASSETGDVSGKRVSRNITNNKSTFKVKK